MGKKIKLFHVSFDLMEPLHKVFIPRVPESLMNGEDETYNRICFSDSVTGCINSIGKVLEPNGETNAKEIIVWEKEIDLSDKNLISWETLYEKNLVPDAAITHEYWYLKQVCMQGRYYQIKNIEEAMENRKQVDIVKPCYREKLLKILSNYGISENEVNAIDTCTLINEWIPDKMKEFYENILLELKKEMTIICKPDVNEEMYEKLFGSKPEIKTMVDIDYLQVFQKIEIQKVFV